MPESTESGEEVFFVRVLLTGPPAQLTRATRYAKENVGRSTDSLLKALGVASTVSVYVSPNSGEQFDGEYFREQSVEFGDTNEDPPQFLDITESAA